MVNAARIASELVSLIPTTDLPETTDGYEGFFHLLSIEGSCERAQLSFIIRDHDRKKFESRKDFLQSLVERLNSKYGEGTLSISMHDQYYNMRERVEPVKEVVDIALEAMKQVGVTPVVKAIRGGTDGAQLSFKGLPCPNIFAGGLNFHGPHEFLPIPSMEKAMMTIVRICELTAKL